MLLMKKTNKVQKRCHGEIVGNKIRQWAVQLPQESYDQGNAGNIKEMELIT